MLLRAKRHCVPLCLLFSTRLTPSRRRVRRGVRGVLPIPRARPPSERYNTSVLLRHRPHHRQSPIGLVPPCPRPARSLAFASSLLTTVAVEQNGIHIYTGVAEQTSKEGAVGDCRVAEEVNTFTIHPGIFTSDNLLAKLGKLASTAAARTASSLIFRFLSLFVRLLLFV